MDPATILVAAAVASAAAGGVSSYQAGKFQKSQSKLQEKQAQLQGRLDAIETNEQLMSNISQGIVSSYASGVSPYSGSPLQSAYRSTGVAKERIEFGKLNADLAGAGYRARGEAAYKSGVFGLLGGAFKGVSAGTSHYIGKQQGQLKPKV